MLRTIGSRPHFSLDAAVGPLELVPELFAVPVDRWVGFHLNVAVDFSLTGQTYVLFRIAEQLQAQQWVDPLVESFHDAFGAAVFCSVLNNNVTAAARPKTHAVQYFVGAGIQLYSVLTGHGANVVAFLSFNGDLLVHEFDCWHVRCTD